MNSDPGGNPRVRGADDRLILQAHPAISRGKGPLLLIVLDGWGESKWKDQYDAIYSANTPVMDSLKSTASQHRWMSLKAHGTAVGLPSDQDMGNSEVGHNALGSGQIVDQGAKCVDACLGDEALWKLEGWEYIKGNAINGTLHLIGLLSDGGVHSRYDQLMLLINGAAKRGVRRIRVHTLSDGRDVPDFTAVYWLQKLSLDLNDLNEKYDGNMDARIASGGGRMHVTMDRYGADWNIVKRGWDAHVLGKAPHQFEDPVEGVRSISQGISDQWIEPWVVVDRDTKKAVGRMQDGDAVVTFNFRADRILEITQAFEYDDANFPHFDREKTFKELKFAGIMQYDGELKLPKHYLVPPPLIQRASEEYLMNSTPMTRVFACSESQKIGHVTFFWNGNRSGYLDATKECFLEIASDQGIPFNQKPAMKAQEITSATIEAITSGKYDFIRCNFANADMVGHTGDLKAAVAACSIVDECVGRLIKAINQVEGRFLVTADHGNAEDMVQRDEKTGEPIRNVNNNGGNSNSNGEVTPRTSHTLNPVPIAIGGAGLPIFVKFKKEKYLESMQSDPPGLANVTATFLNLLGFEAPDFYKPSLLSVVDDE